MDSSQEDLNAGTSGIFEGLGDETRLKLLDLLLPHDLCVGALAHRLEISEAAVSQHLQVLRKAGLIKVGKRAYWTHYAEERNAFEGLSYAEIAQVLGITPKAVEGLISRARTTLQTRLSHLKTQ